MFDVPWAVNGIILQLSPWQPFFEPAFTKLSIAAIFVQIHNLPVEFWDGESLETISALFGRLLKIDDFTLSLSRSKYAKICIEVDLAKLLKQGFWIGDKEHRVFVVVLYERLPTFSYKYGIVGHGSKNCSRRSSAGIEHSSPLLCDDLYGRQRQEVREGSVSMSEGMEAEFDLGPASIEGEGKAADELTPTDYGPWMLVTRRRGRGGVSGSQGSGSHEVHANPRDLGTRLPNVSKPVTTAACATRGGSSLRARGGMVSARGHVSGAHSTKTATFPEKELLLPSLETNTDPETLSALGKEKSMLADASLALVPKEASSLVPLPSPKASDLSDKLLQNSPPVVSKGKEKVILESLEPPGFSPIL